MCVRVYIYVYIFIFIKIIYIMAGYIHTHILYMDIYIDYAEHSGEKYHN